MKVYVQLLYHCTTIVPNFPLYNMHSGVFMCGSGIERESIIRTVQVAVGHHIQT